MQEDMNYSELEMAAKNNSSKLSTTFLFSYFHCLVGWGLLAFVQVFSVSFFVLIKCAAGASFAVFGQKKLCLEERIIWLYSLQLLLLVTQSILFTFNSKHLILS
jgi:hypothetical protein